MQLQDFEIRVLQQRSGASSASQGTASDPTTSTSVYGSATVALGDVDANCQFVYDPGRDAQKAVFTMYPTAPISGRQITLNINFPKKKPSLGDVVDQVVGEFKNLTHNGTFKSKIPPALTSILDIAELEAVQFTLASEQQESSPWKLASVYVRVSLQDLADDINNLLDGALTFEQPALSVTVSDPCTVVLSTPELII